MKKPILPIRILLQVLAWLLTIVLGIAILGTVILLDLRLTTSGDGLQTVINAVLGNTEKSAAVPQAGNPYLVPLADTDFQIPDNIEISVDMLKDTNLLIDYVYDIVNESVAVDQEVSKEQVQQFVDESTIKDYTAEKAASYINDAITGEETTTITVDELMNLLEENQTLLEKHFNVEITPEIKETMRTEVTKVVEEQDINGTIRQEINKVIEQPLAGTDYTVKDILALLNRLTSNAVIGFALGTCLVLMLLIMLLCYYKLPKGLRRIACTFIIVGLLLAVPTFVIHRTPALLASFIPQMADLADTVTSLVGIIAPLHYAVLIIGVVMLAGSIVWSVLAPIFRRKKKKPVKNVNAPVSAMEPLETVIDESGVIALDETAQEDLAESAAEETTLPELTVPAEEVFIEEIPAEESPEITDGEETEAPAEADAPTEE